VEIEKVLKASGQVGRHGARDRTLILLAYRHGLRVSELVTMRWEQIDFKAGLVHVSRLKNGLASTHPSGEVQKLLEGLTSMGDRAQRATALLRVR
jgi:integrase